MACVASGRSIRKERAEEHSGATVEARDAARNAADYIDGGVGAAAGGRPDTTRRAGLPGRYPTVLDRDKRIANTVAPAPKPGPSPAAANWQESWEIDPARGPGRRFWAWPEMRSDPKESAPKASGRAIWMVARPPVADWGPEARRAARSPGRTPDRLPCRARSCRGRRLPPLRRPGCRGGASARTMPPATPRTRRRRWRARR